MKKIKIQSTNKISFTRVKSKYCIKYNIYRCEKNKNEVLINTIINPTTPCRAVRQKVLEFNINQEWSLGDDVLNYTQNDIEVFINGIKLPHNLYTYYSHNDTLIIHNEINLYDSIIVKYYVDKIEYVDNFIGSCTYRIEPIFSDEYLIGNHSILDWRG